MVVGSPGETWTFLFVSLVGTCESQSVQAEQQAHDDQMGVVEALPIDRMSESFFLAATFLNSSTIRTTTARL